jgi:hypothetical protein
MKVYAITLIYFLKLTFYGNFKFSKVLQWNMGAHSYTKKRKCRCGKKRKCQSTYLNMYNTNSKSKQRSQGGRYHLNTWNHLLATSCFFAIPSSSWHRPIEIWNFNLKSVAFRHCIILLNIFNSKSDRSLDRSLRFEF